MTAPVKSRRAKKIVPRWRKDRGWYVRIPNDFRSPSAPKGHQFFGNDEAALADAKDFARKLTMQRKDHGIAFSARPMWQQTELLRTAERIGWDNLKTAADMFEERAPQSQLGIAQIAADCLAAKTAKGVRENSLRALKWTFDQFAAHCTKTIGAVTAADVQSWLDANPQWAAKTRDGQQLNLCTLFNFAIAKKILTESPCDGVERPIVTLKPKKILSVDDLEKLLHTCQKHDPAFLGWMAPVIFGGLRTKESQRMEKGNITKEVIDLDSGEQTKLNARRAFELRPVLKAWLAVKGVKMEQLTDRQKQTRLDRIKKLSGVKVPKNSLRKSCASYWVKLVGAKEAASILGHSETMLFKNYANSKVTLSDAQRFEALRPAKKL